MQNLSETIDKATVRRASQPASHTSNQLKSALDANSRIIIGVDEAGYGPNIGPMLVAGTAWCVPKSIDEQLFVELLSDSFHTGPWSEGCQHVPLGDSKQLYSPSAGLRSLEAGLLAMLAHVLPQTAGGSSFSEVLRNLDCFGPWSPAAVQTIPAWLDSLSEQMPLHLTAAEVKRMSLRALECLRQHGIELLSVKAAIVLESEFNRAVAQFGSKGRLLSTVTMHIVTQLLAEYEQQSVEVFCDRQGGRKKYACVLLEAMPDDWFDTLSELPMRSSYRRQRMPELTFHFSVGGDSFPPTALASMTAKYLRERLMAGINSYWQSHIADLAPTAGYPQDAKRFRNCIERKATELGHDVDQWWRVC